jgi:glycerol-3-phosphate dehydrogenase
VPEGRLVSLEECRRLFPAFTAEGASGGALWHDARLTHPERLTLAFVRAAARQGALVANYCALQRVLTDGGTVQGLAAADRLGGGGGGRSAPEIDAGDIVGYQYGWLPLKAGRERGRPDALADRPRVLEHRAAGGVCSMFSVEGVKFTTARRVAEDIVEATLDARVCRAVREQMAVRLSDVLRRISPGSHADAHDLAAVAGLAAAELGWTDQRKDAEIDAVKRSTRTPGLVPEPTA